MSRGLLVLSVAVTACSPDTDSFPGRGAGGMDGGPPGAVLIEPTPGAMAPQNLAVVVLRLPASLRDEGATAQLRPAEGAPVALGPAAPVDCTGEGRCYAFALPGEAPPGRYVVNGPAGAHFDDGRPVPAAVAGGFSVTGEIDRAPPMVDPPAVDTVGDCLRVRFATDEPVRASLLVRADGIEQALAAGEASSRFDVVTRLGRLTPGAAGALVARATDWAGNRAESGTVQIKVPPPAIPLVITEVLPNPAGPEATQEFVELRNLGAEPISLEGMTIEDGAGADPLPPVMLAPGAFAVVVAAAFNPDDTRDPTPRTSAMLLKVEGKIGRDGIGNTAEGVRIRTSTGEVVSRYGGWIDASPSAWTGHSVQRQPQDACDAPAAWNPRPQIPTPGW